MQATANAIEREVRIDAPPALVYSYFTEPEKLTRWMGQEARLDARPGGKLALDYGGFDRMRGQFVELVPHSRIVFTWGWSTLGDATPPGASRVEVTLTPDGGGTLLKLVHSGLEAHQVEGHAQGWDRFLGFLPEAVSSGKDAQPPHETPSPSERYAARLNELLCDLRYLVEDTPDNKFSNIAPGSGWTAAATAMHAVTHAQLADIAAIHARNAPSPIANVTQEMLDTGNAEYGRSMTSATKQDILKELLEKGPAAVDALKSLEPASLSNGQPTAFANGADVSAEMVIQGPLLANLEEHIADLRAALA